MTSVNIQIRDRLSATITRVTSNDIPSPVPPVPLASARTTTGGLGAFRTPVVNSRNRSTANASEALSRAPSLTTADTPCMASDS